MEAIVPSGAVARTLVGKRRDHFDDRSTWEKHFFV